LWQLPPSFSFEGNAERLEKFFDALPRTTRAASRLARAHDDRVKSARTIADADRPLRYALEVRHPSFVDPAFYALLRAHEIALCVADPRVACGDEVTADFVYVRLHGAPKVYVSGYSRRALESWAARVEAWAKRGRDAYVYFDNDALGRAPIDARMLRSILRGERVMPRGARHVLL
jgi:uncharacterized protein YecE (DUF72 family)